MILVKLHGWIVTLTIQQIENEQIGYCSSENRSRKCGCFAGNLYKSKQEVPEQQLGQLNFPLNIYIFYVWEVIMATGSSPKSN